MENRPHHASEKFSAGTNVPFWVETVPPISYQKLGINKVADVVIVGGGIAGVTIGYCLSLRGKKVAIVEDGFIASGETSRTTAHLASALDDRFYEIERLFGAEEMKSIADSHKYAIDFIEQTIKKEKIECDFKRVNGYLFLHPSDDKANLEREETAAIKAGMQVQRSTIELAGKSVDTLKFSNQARFHPLKYIDALCRAIVNMGGMIYTNTHAKEISSKGIVSDEGFEINADHVVVATNTPVNNKFIPHMKQYAYRTYVLGYKIKKQTVEDALWWDTGDFDINSDFAPYHYVRLQPLDDTHDLLISGGEDHAVGMADADHLPEEDRYGKLDNWTKAQFHNLPDAVYRWSGEVMEPFDAMAYIGRNPGDSENVYIVTGDSGHGMTHGTIAGKLISDLIEKKENEWEKIYSPARFKAFKAGKTFFKQFVGGLVNYIKTKPKHLDKTGVKDILKHEGKVIEFEGKKLGAYRDGDDNIHFVSAECTHQGCMVKWNNDEKSWDCPCHGSRFTFEGEVMHGPANEPLAYYSQNKNAIQNI